MSFSLANGVSVVRGELVFPRIGVWHADLELEDDAVRAGAVKLEWWDQQLICHGTVRYGGVEEGTSRVHLIGGAGGLPTPVKPKAYRNATRRLVVGELLGLAGEKLSSLADSSWLNAQLPFWTVMESNVGAALTLLVELQGGISWRVLADGTFWFGAEPWGKVSLDYEELSRDPRGYQMEVYATRPALMPGCIFLGQRISTVTYRMEESDMRIQLDFEAAPP